MDITLQRRAEIAQRSLALAEKKRVATVLETLVAANPQEILSSEKLTKLSEGALGKLYAYQINRRLRLIISWNEDKWCVEDIVDYDRLNRLFPLQNHENTSETYL
jgi:plasmid maintenance system killer protein